MGPEETNIFLVDDNLLFREGLTSLINNEPDMCVVGEASTVHDAVQKIAVLKPDLVFTELKLPDGGANELFLEIRELSPNTMAAVLTLQEADELIMEALLIGARGYLLKNQGFSNLSASIRAMRRGEFALSRKMVGLILSKVIQVYSGTYENGKKLDDLTPREMEILACLSYGESNRKIANKLSISENTVRVHVYHILKKLNMRTRREVAKYARYIANNR